MSEQVLKGLHQSYIMADEHPALAASGIHMTGHMRAFERSRKRPIDTAGHWLLHSTVSGEGEGLVDGRWVSLPARTAYIVPPGADWAWRYRAKTRTTWDILFVVLGPDFELSSHVRRDAAYVRRDCDPSDLLWSYERLYRESLAKHRPVIMRSLANIVASFARELLDDDEQPYQLSDLWMTVSRDLARP